MNKVRSRVGTTVLYYANVVRQLAPPLFTDCFILIGVDIMLRMVPCKAESGLDKIFFNLFSVDRGLLLQAGGWHIGKNSQFTRVILPMGTESALKGSE